MKIVLLFLVAISLTGCGALKSFQAGITGDPTPYCYQGVEYLQFPSGATVALGADGKPNLCK